MLPESEFIMWRGHFSALLYLKYVTCCYNKYCNLKTKFKSSPWTDVCYIALFQCAVMYKVIFIKMYISFYKCFLVINVW